MNLYLDLVLNGFHHFIFYYDISAQPS